MKIARTDDIPEGDVLKFQFPRGRRMAEGFVTRVGGRFVAYENACKHLPVPLDAEGGRILHGNSPHFICRAHGALYEPATGLCVRGPCEGERLDPLPVEVREECVWLLADS